MRPQKILFSRIIFCLAVRMYLTNVLYIGKDKGSNVDIIGYFLVLIALVLFLMTNIIIKVVGTKPNKENRDKTIPRIKIATRLWSNY